MYVIVVIIDTLLTPSKWDWCPDNNDFVCTKSITPDMAKKSIDKIIKKLNA